MRWSRMRGSAPARPRGASQLGPGASFSDQLGTALSEQLYLAAPFTRMAMRLCVVCDFAIEARDPERAVLPPRVVESDQKPDNGGRAGRPASPIGRGTINGAAAAPRSRSRSPLSSATLRLPLRPQEQTPASMTAEPRDVLAEVQDPS